MQEISKEQPLAIQMFLALDASPVPEIRALIAQELKRSHEQVINIQYKAEIREIPSEDGEWKFHEATGRKWYTLTFPDGEKFTVECDHDGVRLGKIPDSIIG